MAKLENVTDPAEIDRLLKQAKRDSKKRRADASVVPEEWSRLMKPPSPVAQGPTNKGNESEWEDAPRDRWYDYGDMFRLGDYLSDPWNSWTSQQDKDGEARARVSAGGFRAEAVWERSVRSAVQGLFCRPLDWAAEDVQMAGTL